MEFKLKFKSIDETRDLKENYKIKDLLAELELSAQTIVAKQNNELTIEDSIINDGDENYESDHPPPQSTYLHIQLLFC